MLGLSQPELRLALLAIAVRLALLLGATGGDLLLPDYDTSKYLPPDLVRAQLAQPPRIHRSNASGVFLEPQAGDNRSQADSAAAAARTVTTPPPAWLLRGWLVWDAVFFADIASRGYVYEQYYAFFPVVPGLLSHAPAQLFALLAMALNAVASMAGAVLLYRLGVALTRDLQLSATACLFFILNPAAIFHAAPYTEAAFAAASFASLCCLHCSSASGSSGSNHYGSRAAGGGGGAGAEAEDARGVDGNDQIENSGRGERGRAGSGFSLVRLLAATAAVSVSCGLRSNGVVNAGYLGHYSLRHAVAVWPHSKARAVRVALLGVAAAAVSVAPLVLFQLAAHDAFCRGGAPGATRGATVAPRTGAYGATGDEGVAASSSSSSAGSDGSSGGPYDWPRPWCSSRIPYAYGFVQSLYWNVGLLRYWTLQQAPNFLLAMPVLLLSVAGLFEFSRANAGHMARLGLTAPQDVEDVEQLEDVQGAQLRRPALGAAERVARPASGSETTGLKGSGELVRRRRGPADAWTPCEDNEASESAERSARQAAATLTGNSRRGRSSVDSNNSGRVGRSRGFLSPELTVTMFPWAFGLLVAVTSMHVQVATRFLLSSCPPLYWYMAHLWRRGVEAPAARRAPELRAREEPAAAWGEAAAAAAKVEIASGAGGASASGGAGTTAGGGWGAWVAVALWRWCFVYMALGCVLFVNFLPWT